MMGPMADDPGRHDLRAVFGRAAGDYQRSRPVLREEAGLTHSDVARQLEWSPSKVSRIEDWQVPRPDR
jgi:hypothetical protein